MLHKQIIVYLFFFVLLIFIFRVKFLLTKWSLEAFRATTKITYAETKEKQKMSQIEWQWTD